ncbi:hypothetical protein D3227_27305 [Mesorhizobium waimense]|uniref:Uncharacterized protein n=2 Tax=Mesorhizobium waimense TaxID=1300307 RepID=A0A3A5KHW6_9HYPH|nr:hypothetical protein D3227_27305 [Mesorhizobium waimense]
MTGEREIELILAATEWLQTTPKSQRPKPAIVELRERFGLRASDAIIAIRGATDFSNWGGGANDNRTP